MRRWLQMLTVGLFLAGMFFTTQAPAADAAETARNLQHQYLVFPSSVHRPASCTYRNIDLAAGTYVWGQSHDGGLGSNWPRKTIVLAAATYVWEDCLIPTGSAYRSTSSLAAVGRPDLPRARLEGLFDQTSSGWYSWGSYLVPQF